MRLVINARYLFEHTLLRIDLVDIQTQEGIATSRSMKRCFQIPAPGIPRGMGNPFKFCNNILLYIHIYIIGYKMKTI